MVCWARVMVAIGVREFMKVELCSDEKERKSRSLDFYELGVKRGVV